MLVKFVSENLSVTFMNKSYWWNLSQKFVDEIN